MEDCCTVVYDIDADLSSALTCCRNEVEQISVNATWWIVTTRPVTRHRLSVTL